MSLGMFADVSWLAVVLAALAWFVLGAVWYANPLIARMWQQSGGIEVPEDQSPDVRVFGLTYLVYVVAAAVTALIAVATGTSGAGEGALLGVVIGIGYALTSAAITALYDQKPNPFGWFWINGVFNVAGLTVVGLVIGAFAG